MTAISSLFRGYRLSCFLGSALALAALVPVGCVQGSGQGGESTDEEESVGSDEQAMSIILPGPVKCPPEPGCTKVSPKRYRVSPSLVLTRNTESIAGLTDDPILDAHFQLHDVVAQLLAQAGTAGSETPDEWLQRLWDTQNPSAGVFNEGFQPHCSDNGTTINGLPVDCPRPEGQLASNAITTDFRPVGLFNRFDLAPEDGAHCGEYRIVYAMENFTSGGVFGRNFIIFEGQLPNPNPQCGVEACRPVVDFWSSLSLMTNQTDIGNNLKKFYYGGLPGFQPVIELQNYGFGSAGGGGYGTSGGQIRTNQFVDFQLWQLREFQLDLGCDSAGCKLFTKPVTDKNNPFFDFFADTSASIDPGRSSGFQSSFVANVGGDSQVTRLGVSHPNAITNINLIAMDISDKFNAGQSTSQGPSEEYLPQFQAFPTSSFHSGISGELSSNGIALTEDNIVARAETQSCKGCHQISPNDPSSIGGGLNWPQSLGFVHVDEVGDRSQALRCVFLPHRQAVGLGFLQNCGSNPAPIPSTDADCGSFQGGGGGYNGTKKQAADPTLLDAAAKAGAPSPVKTLGGGSKVN